MEEEHGFVDMVDVREQAIEALEADFPEALDEVGGGMFWGWGLSGEGGPGGGCGPLAVERSASGFARPRCSATHPRHCTAEAVTCQSHSFARRTPLPLKRPQIGEEAIDEWIHAHEHGADAPAWG
jgi:hypothetical protein